MKRIMTFAAVAFLAATVSYGDSITNTVKMNVPWGDRFRERCVEVLDAVVAQLNTDTTAIATALATNVVMGAQVQVDVSTTTVSTHYVPRFRGDLLVGQAGAGTGALWVAYGVTTNSWTKQ
jgi:hypothetical protein